MSEPLTKRITLRGATEIGAPNTVRVGLWKVLAISLAATVAGLIVVVAVV